MINPNLSKKENINMKDNSIIEPKRFNIKTPYGIFNVESMRKPASSCNFTYKYKFKKSAKIQHFF